MNTITGFSCPSAANTHAFNVFVTGTFKKPATSSIVFIFGVSTSLISASEVVDTASLPTATSIFER